MKLGLQDEIVKAGVPMSKSTFNPFALLGSAGHSEIPSNLRNAIDKIFRKDANTKVKGLSEVKDWVENNGSIEPLSSELVHTFLKYFT
jgi:hypothetical protein